MRDVQPAGARPPYAPESNWTYELGAKSEFLDRTVRVNFGADWYRTDDYITAATNDFIVKAYDRFNGYVGFGFGFGFGDNWDVRINARNIADDEQVYVGSRGLGGYLVLPPREVMLTFTYKM